MTLMLSSEMLSLPFSSTPSSQSEARYFFALIHNLQLWSFRPFWHSFRLELSLCTSSSREDL